MLKENIYKIIVPTSKQTYSNIYHTHQAISVYNVKHSDKLILATKQKTTGLYLIDDFKSCIIDIICEALHHV